MDRTPGAELRLMLIVIGTLLSEPPPARTAVTPEPLNATADTPVRLEPPITAENVVPCSPDAGVIEVMIGTLGVIRNPSNTADVPVEVVTCKVRAATLAPGAMFIVIGSIVSLP